MRVLFTRHGSGGHIRLSTCCNATTESAGKLCCASWSSKKVSGATDRGCGGGMEGWCCWWAEYMSTAVRCLRPGAGQSDARVLLQEGDVLLG